MKERTTQVLLAAIALLLLANLFKSSETLSPAFAQGSGGVSAAACSALQGQRVVVTNGKFVVVVDPSAQGNPFVSQTRISD
jgi:hypothetical protein